MMLPGLPPTTEELLMQQNDEAVYIGRQRRRMAAAIMMFLLPLITITQNSLLGHDPRINDSVIRQNSFQKNDDHNKQQEASNPSPSSLEQQFHEQQQNKSWPSSPSSSSSPNPPPLFRGSWKNTTTTASGGKLVRQGEIRRSHQVTRSIWTNTSSIQTRVVWTNTSGTTTSSNKKKDEEQEEDDDDYSSSNDHLSDSQVRNQYAAGESAVAVGGLEDPSSSPEDVQPTSAPSPSPYTMTDPNKRRITMVVELSGELGNNLYHLFHGYAMKMQIEELMPNITVDLVGEHQDASKWTRPAGDIKKCFPNLRDFDFSSGRWSGKDSEFGRRQYSQNTWLRQNGYTDQVVDVDNNFNNSMKFVQQMLTQQQQEPDNLLIQEPSNSKISLPYLRVRKMRLDVEKYRTQIQQWLAFDKEACCGVLPDPDELVFHFRNFASEGAPGYLPNKRGFVEVGPKHIVNLLEENLPSNNTSKVTMITRHYEDKPRAADPHITAIAKSGKFHLRVIPEQSGVQDFCLLLHAKHVVATKLSSYAISAGILGNQTSVTTYAVNSTETRTHKAGLLQGHGWSDDSEDPTYFHRFKHVNLPGEYKL